MKRNCNSCKAFDHVTTRCELGKKVGPLKELFGVVVQHKPLEECEKPLNYGDFARLLEERNE